jgi:hypothetical protein
MSLKTGLILLSLIVLVSGVSAVPPLPYEFHGNATINGSAIPAGTLIVAKIGDVEVGNVTAGDAGTYGGPGTFDKRLVVNGDEKQIGQYITFWAVGMQSAQKVKLWAGESQKLDLTFAPGTGGSIDASLTPAQPADTPEIPATEPTQKSPLGVIPVFGAILALIFIARRM